MKLHDLRPAAGSRTRPTRVGRGIAAGGGKTAGRGTKGQKARAGGSIPPWFEGGQTPLHQRIPKLRGFRNPFKVEYEIVNLGRIAALVELGALELGEPTGATKAKPNKAATSAPITVNQEILRAVGLVRTLDKPMKVLGQGEIDRPLFVVADAFSKSAVSKIEAAGGSVQVLQIPTGRLPALGVETADESPAEERPADESPAEESRAESQAEAPSDAEPAREAATVEAAVEPSGERSAAPAPATTRPARQARPTAPAAKPGPAASSEPARAASGKAAGDKAAGDKAAGGKTAGREAAGHTEAGATSASGGAGGAPRAAASGEPEAEAATPARPARPARSGGGRAGAKATATNASGSESGSQASDDESPEAPAGADA
jgi:large subunit ribosomal protein L15